MFGQNEPDSYEGFTGLETSPTLIYVSPNF